LKDRNILIALLMD